MTLWDNYERREPCPHKSINQNVEWEVKGKSSNPYIKSRLMRLECNDCGEQLWKRE